MLNPWLLLAAVLALIGAYFTGHAQGEAAGTDRVQHAWDRAELLAGKARAARLAKAGAVTETLQRLVDDERKRNAKLEEIRSAERRAFTDELRKRPSRDNQPGPGSVPQPAGAGSADRGGATGLDLYREDALFLEGEADLARRIRAQRDSCYRAYNKAREEFDQLKVTK